jgi:hypothetical protein
MQRLCVLCGCSFVFVTPTGHAAPTLVPLDREPVEAELVSLDADGILTFRSSAEANDSLSLSLDRFVRWGNPVFPEPQIIVVLADGGRLVTAAAWAGGVPVRLDGDSLVVLTEVWGERRLPRDLVHGIVFAQRNHPNERQRLEDAVRKTSTDEELDDSDVVLLTNNDRVTGELTALSGGTLEFATSAGPVKLPLSRVEAIIFGNRYHVSANSDRPNLILGTTDGSVLKAERIFVEDKKLTVELTGGVKLDGGSVEDIAFLQSTGGKFSYVSDLEPVDYRHVPYLSIEWPYQRDRNVRGEPLSVGGQQYLKGIGMHSASRLTYRLDGQYKRFDALVAVDDSAAKKGSITSGVYVLQAGQWKPAFTSGIVRGGGSPQVVSVDVSGAEALTLTVDYADRGDELDHADWLDARLMKK